MSQTTNATWTTAWPAAESRPSWRRRLAEKFQRIIRGWRYARGHLNAKEAQAILLDCRDPAGWHLLDLLAVEDVIEQARDIFLDHPELPKLIAEACRQTGYDWHSYDTVREARAEAIARVERFAEQTGIALHKINQPPPAPSAAVQPFIPKRLAAPAARRLPPPPANQLPAPALPKPARLPRAAAFPPVITFNHAAARAEGWDLILEGHLTDGSPNTTIRPVRSPKGEAPAFADDPAAWRHVVGRAREGSPLHTEALMRVSRIERLGIEAACGTW